MKTIIALALCASASAFVGPSAVAPSTALNAVTDMEGITLPVGAFPRQGILLRVSS